MKKLDWKALEDKPVIVYGAGAVGKPTIKMLLALNIKPIGIAVTSFSENDDSEYFGVEIREIGAWRDYADTAIVLIATSPLYHNEIISTCTLHGFKHILPIDLEINGCISIRCYTKLFADHGIPADSETITLGDGTYINPLSKLRNNITEFAGTLAELGDFVIPTVFADERFMCEGLYEYGGVKLNEGDTVLDLGANVGFFSVFAAAKNCYTYAFEPTPALLPFIKHHSELNGDKINIVPVAVSNKIGEATFYLDSYSSGGNSLVVRGGGDNRRNIIVPQITIDDFVKQEGLKKVDFIKADIEGAERLMLQGARETLKNFAPKLALCTYHLPDDKEVLTDLILKANPAYKIEHKWEKLFAHV